MVEANLVREQVDALDSKVDSKLRCTWIVRRTLRICGRKCRKGKLNVISEHDRRCYTHSQVHAVDSLYAMAKETHGTRPPLLSLESTPELEEVLRLLLRSREAELLSSAHTTEERVAGAFALEAFLSGRVDADTPQKTKAVLSLVPQRPATRAVVDCLLGSQHHREFPLLLKEWAKAEDKPLQDEILSKLTLLRGYLLNPEFQKLSQFSQLFKERFGLETPPTEGER